MASTVDWGGSAAVPAVPAPAGNRGRPVRRRAIPRDRLLSRFAALGDETRLVLVTAPPGSGKTTVLSQWADADDRPFAWVRLNEGHNDPAWLLREVMLKLAYTCPLDIQAWRQLSDGGGVDGALWTLLTS